MKITKKTLKKSGGITIPDFIKRKELKQTAELKNNKKIHDTLQDIFRFLQVSDYEIENPENQKAAEYDEMNDDIREKLLRLYKPHNEKFFQIINHRFNWNN